MRKTTAATVLMSTFFALKFFVVIVFKFYVCTLLLFMSLFLFDNAKLWCFSSDSKKKLRFFSNLYGQTPHFRTNSGNRLKSCPKCYLGTNVTIRVNNKSLFLDVKAGYSISDIEGFYFSPSFGCRLGTKINTAFTFSLEMNIKGQTA